jgi:hypothetical protein
VTVTNPACSFSQGCGLAMARSAEAMLRALGGEEVILRFATPAADTQSDARLGLAETCSVDAPISPVAMRRPSSNAADTTKTEMLFSASSIHRQMELRSAESGETLFKDVIEIVHQGRAYRIANVSTDFYGGVPYLYRVTVSE